jgi:hypothetical protein
MYIRPGEYKPKPRRVGCETVKVALQAIGAQCALDGEPNPVFTPQGRYHLPIARILDSFKRDNPAPPPQLALPVSALSFILARGQSASSQKVKALADSCIIAWFYLLLRVGEYTYKPPSANTRTTPFTIGDITLWNNNTPLDPALPESYLLQHCTAATFQLDNGKTYLLQHCTAATFQLDNGKTGAARNATIHHYSTGSPICPIAAIVRGLWQIYPHSRDMSTLFAAYYQPNASKWHLTPSHVNTFLKQMAATMPRLHQLNIPISLISSHSLRAGGAVALHLNNVPAHTIQIMGRWSSDTFITYIHSQLSSFTLNLSTYMSNPIPV